MELDPRVARAVLEPNLAACDVTRAASVHVMVSRTVPCPALVGECVSAVYTSATPAVAACATIYKIFRCLRYIAACRTLMMTLRNKQCDVWDWAS